MSTWFLINCSDNDQYLELFQRAKLSIDQLPYLDKKLLNQMGIIKPGHVKGILKKIKMLNNNMDKKSNVEWNTMERKNNKMKRRRQKKKFKDDHLTPPTSIDDNCDDW